MLKGGVIAQENQEVQIDEDNAANVEEEPHNENEAAQVDHLELDGNEAVENEEPENENQAPADGMIYNNHNELLVDSSITCFPVMIYVV